VAPARIFPRSGFDLRTTVRRGNEIGVGKYCTGAADCAEPASVCSVLLNDLTPYQSHICALQCDLAGETDCGSGALRLRAT
jgi:hypothetical protein